MTFEDEARAETERCRAEWQVFKSTPFGTQFLDWFAAALTTPDDEPLPIPPNPFTNEETP